MRWIWILAMVFASAVDAQEIVCPDEAAVNQPVWLRLDLPEGDRGTFHDGKWDDHFIDTDPTYVAPGAALFFASVPGEYRIIAAVDVSGELDTLEHVIYVGTEAPPDTSITEANVLTWLAEVPSDVRDEVYENPVTGDQTTRQEAVGQTFLNIGKAGSSIGSVKGLDLMLSTALVPALGDNAAAWQPFADALDKALERLKEAGVSATDYAAAFLVIGETLTDD